MDLIIGAYYTHSPICYRILFAVLKVEAKYLSWIFCWNDFSSNASIVGFYVGLLGFQKDLK